jgi:tetratricopeptide (TPR) repeat protein
MKLAVVLFSANIWALFVGCMHQPTMQERMIYTNLHNEKTVEDIRHYLRNHVTDTAMRHQLVDIFLFEYFFEEAIAELETIIRIDPRDIPAYQLLALTLVQSKRTDHAGAARVLQKGIQMDPTRADMHAQLALVYADLHQVDASIQACYDALQLPTDPHLAASIYLILASVDTARTTEYYATAIRLDPRIAHADNSIITIPVYVGKQHLFRLVTHPTWRVRLKNIDALRR